MNDVIVYRINGKSKIKCVGENPRLNQAKSRYTKDIEGLLAQNEGVEGTSTFWMSDAYSPADMLIEEEETVVTATQFEIQTDKSRGEIIWTGAYDDVPHDLNTLKALVQGGQPASGCTGIEHSGKVPYLTYSQGSLYEEVREQFPELFNANVTYGDTTYVKIEGRA